MKLKEIVERLRAELTDQAQAYLALKEVVEYIKQLDLKDQVEKERLRQDCVDQLQSIATLPANAHGLAHATAHRMAVPNAERYHLQYPTSSHCQFIL